MLYTIHHIIQITVRLFRYIQKGKVYSSLNSEQLLIHIKFILIFKLLDFISSDDLNHLKKDFSLFIQSLRLIIDSHYVRCSG